ncbi:MAG TPA: hypothetical protein VFA86_13330 [Gammaproteobacteria bacterium]|nr:hypothetical protein [Gammaproteobacteria bacterium]
MFRVQPPPPEQSPVQFAKEYPLDGFAVRVTDVPLANVALQLVPQSIPDGLLVIVPPVGRVALS